MSDANARPDGFTGFIVREKYSRIHCEEPGYEEVWAEVRTNLIHAERDTFVAEVQRLDQAVVDRMDAFKASFVSHAEAIEKSTTDKARESAIAKRDTFLSRQFADAAANRRTRFALIAPYVRAWNIYDDAYQPVPPPKDDIDAALEWTDDTIVQFLVTACLNGYKGGKGVRSSSSRSSDAPAPPSELPSESEPEEA